MFKKILFSALIILPFSIMAQGASELKFGHVNSQEILALMPQMKTAEAQLDTTRVQFENEIATMTEELQKKYADFQAQKDKDEAIMKMKQEELMTLNQRIENYKQLAYERLQKKQEELMLPIVEMVKKAINEVGAENNFFYIYDTNVPAIVYISPNSVDITPMLKKKLNITSSAPAALKAPAAKPAVKK